MGTRSVKTLVLEPRYESKLTCQTFTSHITSVISLSTAVLWPCNPKKRCHCGCYCDTNSKAVMRMMRWKWTDEEQWQTIGVVVWSHSFRGPLCSMPKNAILINLVRMFCCWFSWFARAMHLAFPFVSISTRMEKKETLVSMPLWPQLAECCQSVVCSSLSLALWFVRLHMCKFVCIPDTGMHTLLCVLACVGVCVFVLRNVLHVYLTWPFNAHLMNEINGKEETFPFRFFVSWTDIFMFNSILKLQSFQQVSSFLMNDQMQYERILILVGKGLAPSMPFKLKSLLPTGFETNYWVYQGSQTSPPCQESVKWIIMKTGYGISKADVSFCLSEYSLLLCRVCIT